LPVTIFVALVWLRLYLRVLRVPQVGVCILPLVSPAQRRDMWGRHLQQPQPTARVAFIRDIVGSGQTASRERED
jgi:hypothetical protein